ncbi:MAG: copper amine oxidase N-terminal domain-containing protein [Tepidibacillus sp.]
MKKILTITLIFAMVFAFNFGVTTKTFAQAREVKVVIDDAEQRFDVPPIIENGHTLVPLRGIFEVLGAEVNWDSKTRIILAKKGDTIVLLRLGDKTAYVNNKSITLEVPAKAVKGSTLVPLRFISESLGANVEWDGNNYTVIISTLVHNLFTYQTDENGVFQNNISSDFLNDQTKTPQIGQEFVAYETWDAQTPNGVDYFVSFHSGVRVLDGKTIPIYLWTEGTNDGTNLYGNYRMLIVWDSAKNEGQEYTGTFTVKADPTNRTIPFTIQNAIDLQP